ncbi:hypothetical protein LR48_Vigan460s000600 [Vigna angularis]|uniref:Uncharacterized protein n=1 Tax=Phaseolus angularis TaxID=3914 RepID=A0A0L9TAU0_PHAAN|nr:hypothetical protein LR48_Vigan460s000600 [Vigna angularis]
MSKRMKAFKRWQGDLLRVKVLVVWPPEKNEKQAGDTMSPATVSLVVVWGLGSRSQSWRKGLWSRSRDLQQCAGDGKLGGERRRWEFHGCGGDRMWMGVGMDSLEFAN